MAFQRPDDSRDRPVVESGSSARYETPLRSIVWGPRPQTTTRWRLDQYVPPLCAVEIVCFEHLANVRKQQTRTSRKSAVSKLLTERCGGVCARFARRKNRARSKQIFGDDDYDDDGGGGGRSLCERIDLTRRVHGYGDGSGTVVARAKRKWSAAGCGRRHRRNGDGHTVTDTTGATIIAGRVPVHTSTTTDGHPLTFGPRQ